MPERTGVPARGLGCDWHTRCSLGLTVTPRSVREIKTSLYRTDRDTHREPVSARMMPSEAGEASQQIGAPTIAGIDRHHSREYHQT